MQGKECLEKNRSGVLEKMSEDYEGTPDLEDVLSKLDRIKTGMKEGIEFINSLKNLFGLIDGAADMGAEGYEMKNLINLINNMIICKRK